MLSTGRITFSTDLRISVLPGTTKSKSRTSRHLLKECAPELPNSTNSEVRSYETKPNRHYGSFSSHQDSTKRSPKKDIQPAEATTGDRLISSFEAWYSFPKNSQLYPSVDFSYTRRRRNTRKEYFSDYGSIHKSGPKYRPKNGGGGGGDGIKVYNRRTDELDYWNMDRRYSSSGTKHASEIPQYQAYQAHHKHDQSTGKHKKRADIQVYPQHDSPIAIYPQGPYSQNSENKGLQPGPNYIEGVWEPEDYTLQIKYTKPEDAGTYICQINTEPRRTQVVHLNVVSE